MLSIVPTPIGNLKDITLRALETLQSSDGIICEDSRRALTLLNHYQIKKPLLVLNDFNEPHEFPRVIEQLKDGANLCLISDAGTPLISDPGYKLIRECIKEGIAVDSLPGATSPIVALTLSGLPPDKFLFWGYVPEKPGKRQKFYKEIRDISDKTSLTHIVFLSPYKTIKSLEEMFETYGDIEIVIARELTKIHQTVISNNLSNWIALFKKSPPKGELIMLLHF